MIDTGASGRQYITLDGQCLGYIAVGDRNAPPVVLVHGWLGYLVKERVPGSQLLLIDDCGHTPMVEQPEVYLAAVKAFLLQ